VTSATRKRDRDDYYLNNNCFSTALHEKMKDGKFNVLIVQFELVMNKDDAKRLKTLNWSHVIVDEGHRLKNRESKLFTMLTGKNGYKSQSRVILSGTPLQNEIHELWRCFLSLALSLVLSVLLFSCVPHPLLGERYHSCASALALPYVCIRTHTHTRA